MSKYKVLIVGYGTVGQNLHKEISVLDPFIYDKYKQHYNKLPYKYSDTEGKLSDHDAKYDLAFICVDTPLCETADDLDVSEVYSAIAEIHSDIYVIKSTCPVGTISDITGKTGKRIVYSPEYYGSTPHCNNFDFDFTVLGGDKSACLAVQQILQYCYDARHKFRITDAKTAELLKFMENSWIATKVSFCTQFYELANRYGISYEELRELFILDPRVNPSHTFVYQDHPYWDTHCLNKDVIYMSNCRDGAPLLKDMIKFNQLQKDKNIE